MKLDRPKLNWPKLARPKFDHETTRHAVKWLLVLDVVVVLVLGVLTWHYDALGYRAAQVNREGAAAPLLSRRVIEYTEGIVREAKPAPPASARLYAYVASAYSGVLESDGQAAALAGTQSVLDTMYPDYMAKTKAEFDKLYTEAKLTRPSEDAAKYTTVKQLQNRLKADGFTLAWDKKIPAGTGKWVKVTDKDPAAPRAGEWKRWNVTSNFAVPAPPAYGSAADVAELATVRQAVAQRDGTWVAKINFWGGTPGTNAPAGIWQDQFYKTIAPDLVGTAKQRDRSYAYAQKILAQTMADAFMECWKVKYTYWTARPDMRDPSIKTAMADPPFPSYISGHSTVSKAAAEVLAVMAPAHAQEWRQMAVDARESRLYAGIHFNADNMEGFALGNAVGRQVVVKRQLPQLFQ